MASVSSLDMQNSGKKRGVSSCIPCYTRKQKCSRHYPCNHCTKRRRPEECAFYSSRVRSVSGASALTARPQSGRLEADTANNIHSTPPESSICKADQPQETSLELGGLPESLTEMFGYFEDSVSNTMAILRKFGTNIEHIQLSNDQTIPESFANEIRKEMHRMPDQRTLDFLVQYFITEVNWLDQLIHPPSFLVRYQKWVCRSDSVGSKADFEFTVLILRICSYALQFLPSPGYTLDTIRGTFLANIRGICDQVADRLEVFCNTLDPRGTLLRVQHLCFSGLRARCEGRTNAFWEAISCATRVAQRVGIHRDILTPTFGETHELEKEMGRRTLCNLFVWDSLLARQLDRVPFMLSALSAENLPRMRLVSDVSDSDAPEGFTERLLQVRLAEFWRSCPKQGTTYDVTLAEERYERFCQEILTSLPAAFDLQPKRDWDELIPALPRQREILHMTMFESICCNFRQALLLEPGQIEQLPGYKQVLLTSQKRRLAAAAIKALESVFTLHNMLGASHTRHACITFYTFETAVPLACLCLNPEFLNQESGSTSSGTVTDPLAMVMMNLTRAKCEEAIDTALKRLQMLAAASKMSEAGARTLSQLVATTSRPTTPIVEFLGNESSWWADLSSPSWPPTESSDTSLLDEVFFEQAEPSYPEWIGFADRLASS